MHLFYKAYTQYSGISENCSCLQFSSLRNLYLTIMPNQDKTKETVKYQSSGLKEKCWKDEILESSCTQGWAGTGSTSEQKNSGKCQEKKNCMCRVTGDFLHPFLFLIFICFRCYQC